MYGTARENVGGRPAPVSLRTAQRRPAPEGPQGPRLRGAAPSGSAADLAADLCIEGRPRHERVDEVAVQGLCSAGEGVQTSPAVTLRRFELHHRDLADVQPHREVASRHAERVTDCLLY